MLSTTEDLDPVRAEALYQQGKRIVKTKPKEFAQGETLLQQAANAGNADAAFS